MMVMLSFALEEGVRLRYPGSCANHVVKCITPQC